MKSILLDSYRSSATGTGYQRKITDNSEVLGLTVTSTETNLNKSDLVVMVNEDNQTLTVTTGSTQSKIFSVKPSYLSTITGDGNLPIFTQSFIAKNSTNMTFAIMYQGVIPTGFKVQYGFTSDSNGGNSSISAPLENDMNVIGIEIFQVLANRIVSLTPMANLIQAVQSSDDTPVLTSSSYVCQDNFTITNRFFQQNMDFDSNNNLWVTIGNVSEVGVFSIPLTNSKYIYSSDSDLQIINASDLGLTGLTNSSVIKGNLEELFLIFGSKGVDETEPDNYLGSCSTLVGKTIPTFKVGTTVLKLKKGVFVNNYSIVLDGSDLNTATAITNSVLLDSNANTTATSSASDVRLERFAYNSALDFLFIGVDNRFGFAKPWLTVLNGTTLKKERELRFNELVSGEEVLAEDQHFGIYTNSFTGLTSIVTSREMVSFDGAFTVQYFNNFSGYQDTKTNTYDPIRGLLYRNIPYSLAVSDEQNFQLSSHTLNQMWLPSITTLNSPRVQITGLLGGNQQVFPKMGGSTPINQPLLIFKLYPINMKHTMQFVLFRHTNGSYLAEHQKVLDTMGAKLRVVSWYDPNANSNIGGATMGLETATFADYNACNASDKALCMSKTVTVTDTEYDVNHSISPTPLSDTSYVSKHASGLGWLGKADGTVSDNGTTAISSEVDGVVPFFFTRSKDAVDNTVAYLSTSATTNILLDKNGTYYNTNNVKVKVSETGVSSSTALPIPIPFSTSNQEDIGVDIYNPVNEWKRVGNFAPTSTESEEDMLGGKYGVLCDSENPDAWLAVKVPTHQDKSSFFVLYGFVGE